MVQNALAQKVGFKCLEIAKMTTRLGERCRHALVHKASGCRALCSSVMESQWRITQGAGQESDPDSLLGDITD